MPFYARCAVGKRLPTPFANAILATQMDSARSALSQNATTARVTVADRFTAENFRFRANSVGLPIRWPMLHKMLTQAADTEEMMERIASADPALIQAVFARVDIDINDVEECLHALAAVLKHGA